MAQKPVKTDDPRIAGQQIDEDHSYTNDESHGNSALFSITFETADGRIVTFARGDTLVDGHGDEVGKITKIRHHPDQNRGSTPPESDWKHTVWIDYQEGNTGGAPLGELARQYSNAELGKKADDALPDQAGDFKRAYSHEAGDMEALWVHCPEDQESDDENSFPPVGLALYVSPVTGFWLGIAVSSASGYKQLQAVVGEDDVETDEVSVDVRQRLVNRAVSIMEAASAADDPVSALKTAAECSIENGRQRRNYSVRV